LSREQANDALLEEILENTNSPWSWEDDSDDLWGNDDHDYEDWTGYASD